MAHIALIDDDLTEAMVLEGMLSHGDGGHALTHFQALEDFPHYPDNRCFDLVLLDRRIPPHVDFDTSLKVLAATRYTGPVVPISAADMEPPQTEGLKLTAPVLKSALLTPEAVADFVNRTLASD